MNNYLLKWKLMVVSIGLLFCSNVFAHSGDLIQSAGTASAIDVTTVDVSDVTEWTTAGATEFNIDNAHPNTAHVYAVHRSDGIYLRIEISDDTPNNGDTLKIYFDLAHDGGASLNGNDWGVEITRDGVNKKWGDATVNSASWSNIPAADVGMTAALSADPWIVELRLPQGTISPPNTHTLDFAQKNGCTGVNAGCIGIYFQIFSALENFTDPFSTTYNQWPNPAMETILDTNPGSWGNYEFDALTTFPDVAVTGVRNGYSTSENYYKISHLDTNRFQVRLNNSGGTAIPNASNVRVNLYLAARR